MNILFKIPSKSRPKQAYEIIMNIYNNCADKLNCKILMTADKDDETMYNYEFVNSVKDYVEAGFLLLCFDESKSRIDAINRDMKLVTNYDLLCYVPDDVEFKYHFDNDIRELYKSNFNNKLDGKLFYDSGSKDILVIGKQAYLEQGYIYNPKPTYNLLVNYYTDKIEERNKELIFCITENIKNQYISNIVVICTENDYIFLKGITESKKIIPIITESRPTYNDYFLIIRKLFSTDENINIISNLDIIIPESSLNSNSNKSISDYLKDKKCCLALSRWDINYPINYSENSVLFDRADSQDTWVFIGGVNEILSADFTLGLAGCDNSIAYLLENNGYTVLNPSKTIKTYHYHLTDIRNYADIAGNPIFRLPPPYKLITPHD